MRKFNPNEPRDPHTGKWIDTTPGDGLAHAAGRLWDDILETYGDEYDSTAAGDFTVAVFTNGDLGLFFQVEPDRYEVVWNGSDGSDVRDLRDRVNWALEHIDAMPKGAENDPKTGMVDYGYATSDDIVVGFTSDEEVVLRVPKHADADPEDPDQFDSYYPGVTEASELSGALDEMADAWDELHAEGTRSAVQARSHGHSHVLDNGLCTTCDEMVEALCCALDELENPEQVRAAFDPTKHPRNPKGSPGGGRFRSMVDRLKDAIEAHLAGDGDGHPFDGFDREQLRRVAKARGITLSRGEGRDSIAQKLLDDLKVKTGKPGKPAVKPRHEPLTRRELLRVEGERDLSRAMGALKHTKDPHVRAELERRVERAREKIDQKSGGFYNFDSPYWDEEAAVRIVGEPDPDIVAQHVEETLPTIGLPAPLFGEIDGELQRQSTVVPKATLQFRKVEAPSKFDHANHGDSVFAYYNSSWRSITYNPRWISDRADFDRRADHAHETRWWTHTDAESHAASTFAHEFGHHVGYRVIDDANYQQLVELGKAFDDGLRAGGTLVQMVRVKGNFAEAVDEWLQTGLNRASVWSRVSQYGGTNHQELVAEIWREHTTSNSPRRHIAAMGGALQRLSEELEVVYT